MFTRPHCRDWMPLLTQQLRLRNVIKIIGENIECSQNKLRTQCKIYYTLHHNLNDDPIYKSELITLLGNGNANWAEIDCDLISRRAPCRSICIKVWQKTYEANESYQLCSYADSKKDLRDKCYDEILFVWGVNFSGLILISRRSEIKFKPNTLLFQIHGSYFTSPNKIIITIDKTEKLNQVQQDNVGHISNSSKSFHVHKNYDSTFNLLGNKNKFKNELTYSSDDSLLNKNCDIRNSSEHLNSLLSPNLSSSLGIQTTHNFQNPVTLADSKKRHINLSEKNIKPNIDSDSIENDIDEYTRILKIRNCSYNFHSNEIRASFDVEKLLEIQKQQRKSKLCLKDIKEISEHICLRSAHCISLQLVANIKPGAIYHNYNKSKNSHSMGRTLNRLLFQEAEIKPEEVLKAQGLKKRIENAKFRLQILKEEKQRLQNNYRNLEKKLSELSDKNVEMGSWLMSRYRNLSKEKEFLVKENIDIMDKRETLLKTQAMLRQVKSQFCSELKEIFQIEKRTSNKYTICKIYLPNSDDLCNVGNSQGSIFVVVPISLSSALGYVAHVVQMCSIVLNISLRNPIKCEGSRSKIFDNIKELPNTSREFPLYTRTYPPPKSVLYAIYLLNQNIGQLNLQSNGIDHCDPRATLENLLQLLNGPTAMGNFLLQLPNFEHNENIHYSKNSVSSSSTDLNLVPIPSGIAGKPIDVVDYIMETPSTNVIGNDQRISRSVGSYSDENFENLSDASHKAFYNSEPNLTTHSIAVHLENITKNENF